MAAGGPSSFLLIEKNQKIKLEKTFSPQGHTPGPVFQQAFARFLFSGVLVIAFLLMIVKFQYAVSR